MSQLVYFHIPAPPRRLCRPLAEIRSAVPPPLMRTTTRVSVGEIAQYDECEDDCDPYTQVPVRYRGRVAAAPLAQIRPVL